MAFLVDSDVAIDYLAADQAALALLHLLAADGIAISVITYAEAYQGVLRAVTPAAEHGFQAFVAGIQVIPVALQEAVRCAQLRHQLQREGRRTRTRALDLLTAATAIEHDLTLVTRNVADYRDMPDLKLYPWT